MDGDITTQATSGVIRCDSPAQLDDRESVDEVADNRTTEVAEVAAAAKAKVKKEEREAEAKATKLANNAAAFTERMRVAEERHVQRSLVYRENNGNTVQLSQTPHLQQLAQTLASARGTQARTKSTD
jgi:hypothetical protein